VCHSQSLRRKSSGCPDGHVSLSGAGHDGFRQGTWVQGAIESRSSHRPKRTNTRNPGLCTQKNSRGPYECEVGAGVSLPGKNRLKGRQGSSGTCPKGTGGKQSKAFQKEYAIPHEGVPSPGGAAQALETQFWYSRRGTSGMLHVRRGGGLYYEKRKGRLNFRKES